MSEDKSVVQKLAAPPLAALKVKSKLAPTPAAPPRYSVRVRNAAGQEVVLADPRATRALVALMDVHAVNGGAACHWGGPAAFAEIMAAIHGIMFAVKDRPWHTAYNFVNDAGHTENGIYALRANYGYDGMSFEDLKGFRGIQSKLTGHGESHLNPQGVLLSNGPLSSAVAQSQGLALADHLLKNDRVTVCTVSDGASMEGEAKEAFAAIPGLAGKGLLNPFLLALSDNDTKLSGRITKDSFSMQPTFAALSVLGWNVIQVADGNDHDQAGAVQRPTARVLYADRLPDPVPAPAPVLLRHWLGRVQGVRQGRPGRLRRGLRPRDQQLQAGRVQELPEPERRQGHRYHREGRPGRAPQQHRQDRGRRPDLPGAPPAGRPHPQPEYLTPARARS